MATWYVDKNAVGANNGTSGTDAWTDIASIVTPIDNGTIAPRDTVLVKRGQTHTANLNASTDWLYFPTSNVCYHNSQIYIVAVNADWSVPTLDDYDDVTGRVILDGVSGTKCRDMVSAAQLGALTWVGFEFRNPARYNVIGSGSSSYWQLISCIFRGGTTGLYLANTAQEALVFRCRFYNQTTQSAVFAQYGSIQQCLFVNSPIGVYAATRASFINCCFVNLTSYALMPGSYTGDFVTGCIFHNCGVAIKASLSGSGGVYVNKCKFTNNTTVFGVSAGVPALVVRTDCEYFGNGTIVAAGITIDRAYGLQTNLPSDEYVDAANGNYNKTPGATNREVASRIDALNYDHSSIGLHPSALSQALIVDVKKDVWYASNTLKGELVVGGGSSPIFIPRTVGA